MRKIKFDEATITEIRNFAETHTFMESCNRFTLKPDVMKRVSREHEIVFVKQRQSGIDTVPPDVIDRVRDLYENTNMTIHEIRDDVSLRSATIYQILTKFYSEKYRSDRKRRMYRNSKLGEKNPMLGKSGEQHPRYKGLVEDGNGYLMCVKPDWYTGRAGSHHVFYHSVVMCEALGITEIPKGFVVHHIDRNKKNNDISNLALISVSGHSKLHSIENNLAKVQRSETIRRDENPQTPDNG